jgi:uncharacterized membrane protein
LSTSWEQAVRTHPVDKLLEHHCYKSAAGLLQLVRFYVCVVQTQTTASYCRIPLTLVEIHKLLQICSQAADKLCLFPVVVTSLDQAANNLSQAWWHYQTCYKVVFTSLIQSWHNKNVTRLTTQTFNNIVISWLYRTCWNNLATNLIISTRLLQLLTACSKLVDNLGQAVRTQLVDGLLADLLQDTRFLRLYTGNTTFEISFSGNSDTNHDNFL